MFKLREFAKKPKSRSPLCAFLLLLSSANYAHAETPSTLNQLRGDARSGTGIQNLDLSSTKASARASNLGGMRTSNTAVIHSGGEAITVTSNTLLTPAQLLATLQVNQTGNQSILLSPQGNATGGTFTIGPNLARQITSLTVPVGVTGYTNEKLNSFVLSGPINNFGSIIVNALGPSFSLSASELINASGASISSSLPIDLSFHAVGNIINNGIIHSAGNMVIDAGKSITNSGILNATKTLNIQSGTGIINNSGLLNSNTADIIIGTSNPERTNLFINNESGIVQAALGSINIGNFASPSIHNVTALDGSFIARSINILASGKGSALLDAQTINGIVNVSACESHIFAATSSLQLGTITLSGDPTFYNTAGDVIIQGSISTLGNPLAIIASGNIYATSAAKIDTSATTGNGGEITIVAGAKFSSTGKQSTTNDSTSTLTITGASDSGGFVDLRGNLSTANKGVSIVSLKSASENVNGGNGGNILVAAFSGTAEGSGQISLPATLIVDSRGRDSGSLLGKNGNVMMIAGADISIGGINTAGATGGGGEVVINTAEPSVSTSIQILNGAILNGSTFEIGPTTQNGSVTISSLINAAGSVSVQSASFSSTSAITVSNNSPIPIFIASKSSSAIQTGSLTVTPVGSNSNGGVIYVLNEGSGGINVTGNIAANGIGTGTGGRIFLEAASTTEEGPPSSSVEIQFPQVNVPSTTGGGPLSLNSAFSITADGGNQGAGGQISISGRSLNFSGSKTISVSAKGPGDIGGDIAVTATAPGSGYKVGNSAGRISVTTQSANGGGHILLSCQGPLEINPTGLISGATVSGSGDTMHLTSFADRVLVTGSLNVDGKSSTGSGGYIQIFSNSTVPFEIGNAAAKNGVWGTLSASGNTNGGVIILSNAGTGGMKLLSQANINVANGANGSGGAIVLNSSGVVSKIPGAGGLLEIPAGTYSVDAKGTGAYGGVIKLLAKDIAVTGGPSLSLTANSPTGSGGLLGIELYDVGANLSIGPTGKISQLSATGAIDGGAVQVTTIGNLTLETKAGILISNGASGSGGHLKLASKQGTLTIPAGSYSMDAGATGPFAGSIEFEGNNIALSGGTSISLNANASKGAGGLLKIAATNAASNLDLGALGLITQLSADGADGDGGRVFVQAGGNLTLDAQSTISMANGPNGSGGVLSLISGNKLTIPAGTYSVNAQGTGSSAGSILFAGQDIVLTGGSNLTLNANAPQGSGGSLNIFETGAGNNLQLDNSGGLLSQLSANGSKGDGGRIVLVSGGDLFVDSTRISFSNGGTGSHSGGVLTFASGASAIGSTDILASSWIKEGQTDFFQGTGTIPGSAFASTGTTRITQPLNASGTDTGFGGKFFIYSNSSKMFDIGGSSVNGVGSLTAKAGPNGGTGGTVSVINFGSGGVHLGDQGFLRVTAGKGGSGGTIILGTTAGSAGPVDLAAGTLSADGDTAGGAGGTIELAGSKLTNPGGKVILTANSYCCTGTGSISITTTATDSDLTIDTAVGNVALITNSGSVSVTAGRNLTVDPAGIDARDITLKAGYNNNSGSLVIDGSGICCDGGTVKLEANGNISIGTSIEADSVSVLANKSGNITLLDSLSANTSKLSVVAAGNLTGDFLNTTLLRAETDLTLAAGVDAIGGDANNLQFNGSKGTINLATSSPLSPSTPDVYTVLRQGNVYAGGVLPGSSGGHVIIKADGDVNIGFVTTYGGGGPADVGGDIDMTSNTGNIMVNGEINASGGTGLVFQTASGLGLRGGNISISAPGASSEVRLNGPIISQSNTSTGDISVSAKTVSLNSKFEDYFVDGLGDPYITSGSPLFGQSAFASGTLNIIARTSGNGAVVTSNVYSSNGNLSSTKDSITANLLTTSNPLFTVNAGSYGAISNGSIGGLKSGTSVTFNGIPMGKTVSATININNSTRILENGAAVTITDGQTVSPAEWIALIQLSTIGKQLITLDANGAAAGGSFDIAPVNLPVGGFTKLVIPAGLTANLSIPTLAIAVQGPPSTDNDGLVTLNGTLNFSGALTFSATSFSGTGMIHGDPGSALTIGSSNGNIGTSAQAISFVADDLTVNAGGATSTVFLTNPESGTTIHASSTAGAFQVSAFGSITTSGDINAKDVSLIALAGSDGGLNINSVVGQASGNLVLSADGTGNILVPLGVDLEAASISLSSGSGTIGTFPSPISVKTTTVSANTSGSVFLSNAIPAGNTTLSLLSSSGNFFRLTTDSNLAVNGAVSGDDVTLLSTAPAGTITLNAPVTVTGGGAMTMDAFGDITGTAQSNLTAGTFTVNSTNGQINLGGGGSNGGILNVDILNLSAGTNANITNSKDLDAASSTAGGTFNITAPSLSAVNLTMDSGTITTYVLNNSGSIAAGSGSLSIKSPTDGDLSIAGAGTLSASTNILLSSDNGNVLFNGDQTLSANGVSITAPNGAVQIDTGFKVTSNAAVSYNISGVFFGDPGTQLVINSGVPATLTPISQSTTLGTIAAPIAIINPNGSVNLTGSMLIGSSGKNVAIIAEGDVISTAGLKTIDLSSKTGRSGSLVILAGFDFSPVPATTPLDTQTLFANFSPAPAGGSINLSKTTINTSNGVTLTSPNRGGSILMVANAGSAGGNPGTINLGSINSSAKAGFGGKVELFGPGGINVNGAINTSGNLGAGSVTLAATPASSSGTILVFDGYLSPTAKFNSTGTVPGSGAAVSVAGAITSNSTAGLGAAVTISAESTILLSKGITTSGLTGSGPVSLATLNGNISSGAINTSGVSISDTKSTASAGNGAAFTAYAPAYISIAGISTAGGSTKGSGNGGNAGAVSVTTSSSSGYHNGNLSIAGAVNASGGNAVAGKGAGGSGATVTLQAGALQVTKTVTINGVKASVISSGGTGTTTGSHGSITIDTYAVQAIPTNFNLGSTTLSEIALPGGLFTVGATPLINGTAGNIVSGSDQAKTGNYAIGGGFNQGKLAVNANAGASQTIDIGGSTSLVAIGNTNTTRSKISPAEAVALYQVSFGNAQTMGLTARTGTGSSTKGGQASDTNLQSSLQPSLLIVPEYDLPAAGFKSFVLSAVAGSGTVNDIEMQITGLSPVLNISKASPRTLNGQIEFPDALNASINAGTAALSFGSNSSVSSAAQLTLLGTGWTNNGTISAGSGASPIVMAAPGKSITLTNNATGTLNGSVISVPANGLPTKFTFINNKNAQAPAVSLSPTYLPSQIGAAALSMLQGSAQVASSTLSFTMGGANGVAQLTGIAPSITSALSINTNKNPLTKALTDLSVLPGTDLTTGKTLTLKSSGNIALGAAASPQAVMNASKIAVGASAGAITSTGTTLTSKSDLSLSALNFTDNGGSNYNSTSSLGISAKSVSIGVNAASALTAATKGMKVVASAGTLSIGNVSSLTADSGTILLQATGPINLDSNLKAGSTGLPGTALLDSDISKSGSISIKSGTGASPGGLTIAGNLSIQAAGTTKSPGNISASITGGDITFSGSNTTMQANGGNLVLLSTGNIVSNAGANNFVARGVAVSATPGASNKGGGIEFGAGTTASKLAAAVALASPQQPPGGFLGTSVTVNDGAGAHGVVVANAPALAVNLSTTNPATIDVSKGGAVVFDAANSKTIQLNGANFTTQAYKPIAYSIGPDTEILVEKRAGKAPLANIFVARVSGPKVLFEDGMISSTIDGSRELAAETNAVQSEISRLVLLSGEMFINPLKPTIVDAGVATISIKKGALVLLSQESELVRVTACSGPNDVIVACGDKQFKLLPGEELILSPHKLEDDEVKKADGVGRRYSTIDQTGNGFYVIRNDVSLLTMLSSIPYMNAMAHSNSPLEKRITRRIFKTAAILGQITNYRGRYEAKSNGTARGESDANRNEFVSMEAK